MLSTSSRASLASLGLTLLLIQPGLAKPGSGLDLSNLDRSTPPSKDFFQYANGGWLKSHPIPPDKPRWGTFNQLLENNQSKLQAILENCQRQPRDDNSRKLAAFYSSGLNPESLRLGRRWVQSQWELLDLADSPERLQQWVTQQHKMGCRPFFSFSSGQDYKDSRSVIGQLNQGGLGLPDSGYYLRFDEKSSQIRQAYLQLIQDSFELWGLPASLAQSKAEQVLALETRLAQHSLTLVEQRDPQATYHPTSLEELALEYPNWNWPAYFQGLGAPALSSLNVAQPKFFAGLDQLLQEVPPKQIRSYLQWTLLRSCMEYLSEDWAELHFGFYGKTLTGAQSIAPRWRRVVKVIDTQMGDALGEKYVARHFPPAAKAKVEKMVGELREALSTTLDQLEWMSQATKTAAQAKLKSFRAKIGYPERWKDYSALSIQPDCYVQNVFNAQKLEIARDLAKIGRPQDSNEWYLSPPTVNAYYDPQNNEIVFPAGIMQPPFFDLQADDAVNYGGLGMVIGHEITHGFDDQGAQFDGQGNLRNWWSEEDLSKFQGLARAIEEQFSQYQVADGLNINGKLVVGESIADLGGLKLAYMAYQKSCQGQPAVVLDGFTPEQRFFLGYARIWAMNMRTEYERLQVNTDPHPHPKYRVNGPLSNLQEFHRAFNCPPGSAMVRAQRNRVW